MSVVEFQQLLSDHSERLFNLEQTISAPSFTGPKPPVIVSPPNGGPAIVLAGPENGPANLHLTHHLAGSTITVVAQWDPVDDAVAYDLQWATKNTVTGLYTIVNTVRTIATSMSVSPLLAATTYGFKVYAVNNLGRYSLPSPAQGYIDIETNGDLTPPPAPQNVVVALGQTSVIVRFDPYDPAVVTDLQAYHIQISSDGFATYQEIFTTAFVVQFPNVDTVNVQWVARVSGIDTSSNEGPYSTSTNYPVRSSQGVNDAMMVGDFDAAHITFGTMLGDRIEATTLSVQALQTSNLTAADVHILGGALTAGDISGVNTGLLLSSQGLRLYNGGSITVALDALTGSASFSGTINASTINGGTINGAFINGGTITAVTFTGITVNASTINGGTINSTTLNSVNVNAGTITGVHILGGLIESNPLGAGGGRLDIAIDGSSNAIVFYTGSGYEAAPGVLQADPVGAYDPSSGIYYPNLFLVGPNIGGGVAQVKVEGNNFDAWGDPTIIPSGVPWPSTPGGPAVKFQATWVVNDAEFYSHGPIVTYGADFLAYSGGAWMSNGYNAWSSRILKRNVESLASVLEKLERIRVVKFDWMEEFGDDQPHYGFIAEELFEVDPVLTAHDGKLAGATRLNEIIAFVMKAVQELSLKVRSLESQLAANPGAPITQLPDQVGKTVEDRDQNVHGEQTPDDG